MRRPSLLLALVALAISAGPLAAQSAEPIAEKLEKAKATYQQKVERFKADLLKDLDVKENQARAKGDKKAVDQVKAERAAFTERGTLPKSVPTTAYETRVKQARVDAEAVYAAVIKDLVRGKQDDRAAEVERQLADFRKHADGAAGAIDLLAMIDLAQDATKGRWTRDGRSITNALDAKAQSWLRLPYQPPDEYELEIEATRVGGDNDLMIGGTVGGRTAIAMLDGFNSTVSGIALVDGRQARDNPSSAKGRVFTNDKRAIVAVRFTKEGVSVAVDGKPILNASPLARVGGADLRMPGAQLAILIAPNASYRIDAIRLKPISGAGKPTR